MKQHDALRGPWVRVAVPHASWHTAGNSWTSGTGHEPYIATQMDGMDGWLVAGGGRRAAGSGRRHRRRRHRRRRPRRPCRPPVLVAVVDFLPPTAGKASQSRCYQYSKRYFWLICKDLDIQSIAAFRRSLGRTRSESCGVAGRIRFDLPLQHLIKQGQRNLPLAILARTDTCALADSVWLKPSTEYLSQQRQGMHPLAALLTRTDACVVTDNFWLNPSTRHLSQ